MTGLPEQQVNARLVNQLMEGPGLLVCIKDAELRFLRVSRDLGTLLSPYCTSPLGRRLGDILPDGRAERIEANDRRALREGATLELEETLTLGGIPRTFLSTRLPLGAAAGEAAGICTIATEITARKRIETALHDVGMSTAGLRGRALYERLVRDVARTLCVDLAFIAVVTEDRPTVATTLGVCCRGQIVDNLDYRLQGTPCREVLADGFQFVPDNLADCYPEDEALMGVEARSYAGYPLFDGRGQLHGLIAVAHADRLVDAEGTRAVLHIHAARAAGERERELGERARVLSQRSYQEIFDASEDAIFVHDIDSGAIVDVNPRACSTYGYSRDALCSTTVASLSSGEPPYTEENARCLLQRARDGEVVRTEWHRRNRDGSLHWDELVLRRVELGGTPRILAITREISERKAAEEALRASEERYRTIFNASVDGLSLWSAGGRMVDVNRAFCGMHGYTREELLTMDPRLFVHPDAWVDFEAFLEALRLGQAFHAEAMNVDARGRSFPVEVTGAPMEYRGEPHALVIVRDIAERREREQALRHSEDRLRATVEAAIDCIICMDEAGAITEFNPAAEQCFGYRRGDVLGRPLAELLIPARLRDAHRTGMSHYRRTGSGPYVGRRVEVTALRADGTEFPAELAIAVTREPAGEIFVGYMRDVTEVRLAEEANAQLEAQLRQAQKMEAIGQLTGGIAHDFNNILTSILGYAVLIQEQGGGSPRLPDYLSGIRRSAEQARDLIRQMLAFSRGQRGDPRPLALPALIEDVVRLYRSTFPATIRFRVELDSGLPPVLSDPLLLEQALMNLAINARDAMSGRGEITIGARRRREGSAVCASCRKATTGDWVDLFLADTGPGIPPAIQDRIFEPFFSTKEVGHGSGMGLATIHGVIHEHCGHILLESAAGHGARMHLLLPPCEAAAREPEQPAEPAPEERSAATDAHVLIVDDEVSVRGFMADLLVSRGFRVSLAADGDGAMDLLAREAPQLVVTDYLMPGLTGVALAKRIHRSHPEIPILLFSGNTPEQTPERLQAAGIQAVLTKPIDVGELMRQIHGALVRPAGAGVAERGACAAALPEHLPDGQESAR